jgi:hypothetical protein
MITLSIIALDDPSTKNNPPASPLQKAKPALSGTAYSILEVSSEGSRISRILTPEDTCSTIIPFQTKRYSVPPPRAPTKTELTALLLSQKASDAFSKVYGNTEHCLFGTIFAQLNTASL